MSDFNYVYEVTKSGKRKLVFKSDNLIECFNFIFEKNKKAKLKQQKKDFEKMQNEFDFSDFL